MWKGKGLVVAEAAVTQYEQGRPRIPSNHLKVDDDYTLLHLSSYCQPGIKV